MQERTERRSNRVRSEEMRRRLLEAARRLFVEKGFADTGTPEIVAAAGVTRGALYHHFEDKRALFRAVAESEAAAVSACIAEAAEGGGDPLGRLLSGARAYLDAMALPGRTRLLLVEGPAVLGERAMREIETGGAEQALREGLADAVRAGVLPALPLDPVTSLLSAMFDRAALDVATGGDPGATLQVVEAVLAGLSAAPASGRR